MKRNFVVPYGGLCNRLRVIASAVSLSKKVDASLEVLWQKIPECYICFSDIFEPVQGIEIVEGDGSTYKWPSKKNLFLPLLRKLLFTQNYYWDLSSAYYGDFLNRIKYRKDFHQAPVKDMASFFNKNRNVVVTCGNLEEDYDLSIFKPVPQIQRKIDDIANKFPNNIYGFHIRRTDNVASMDKSPDYLFSQKIDSIIEKDQSACFYLATDDLNLKNKFKEKYGNSILTYEATLERNSEVGMYDAVIELFLLSRTKKIYGSYWSSYTEMAAKLGNIDLEVLVK